MKTHLCGAILSCVGLLLLSSAIPARAGTVVADSVNAERATYSSMTWGVAEGGWFYTPGHSYELVGIETKFDTTDGRTVTVEVWDEHPEDGGVVLRTDSFTASTDFAGISFAGLTLTAGEDFFVGFRGVKYLGVNITEDAGATVMDPFRCGETSVGAYPDEEVGYNSGKPILRFLAPEPIPEPAGLGLIGAALLALRRRRH